MTLKDLRAFPVLQTAANTNTTDTNDTQYIKYIFDINDTQYIRKVTA